MPYAINSTNDGWRAIGGEADLITGETYSVTQPVLTPTLTQAQAAQIALLSAACQTAIVSGFTSSGLGSPYTYGSNPTDQINLSANVLSSILPGVGSGWTTQQLCADSTGAWAYRPHTAAQIQQVGLDAKTAIETLLLKNATLQASVMAASTVAAVQAITW